MNPGTLYRRALRRVERRRVAFIARRPLAYQLAEHSNHCAECARDYRLLCEAVCTANRLFMRSSEARGLLTVRP